MGARTRTWTEVVGGTGGPGGVPEAPADGKQYGRQNTSWTEIVGGGAAGDYLPLDGSEPMTGPLFIHGDQAAPYTGGLGPASATLMLNKAGAGNQASLSGLNNGLLRWQISLGNATAESGASAGSGLVITNYDDAGASLGLPLQISRATGACTFSQPIIETSNSSLKTEVRLVTDALGIVAQLQGVFYKKAGMDKDQVGLIAEDVEPVLPEVVFETEGDEERGPTLGVAYGNVVAVLIEAYEGTERQGRRVGRPPRATITRAR